jgi:hypothetical protein
MAVVRLEIKTRQPLADGRKFDNVGCYEQLDGTAHFAVDPAHRLNCAVTDIDLAERRRDGWCISRLTSASLVRPTRRGATTACCSMYRTAATG